MKRIYNYTFLLIFSLFIFSCNDNEVHDYLQDFSEFVNETEMLYENKKLDDLSWNEREKKYLEFTGYKFEKVKEKMTPENLKSMERIMDDYEKISVKVDPFNHLPEFFGF